jgi:quinol monooxygenase YgiN
MIKRIVKLHFKKENIEAFVELFEKTKDKIIKVEGCLHLELFQDIENPSIFFTYSFWEEEVYLEKYRNSEFFNDTWRKTKALFGDKPEAWSVKVKSVIE